MKILSFKQFVKEEGSYDTVRLGGDSSGLDNPKVRGAINANLQRATNQHFLTPYMGLGAIARVLAFAHIIVPQYTFLNNDGGEVVFDASPIGKVDGLTVNAPSGKGSEVQPTYHVYFEYEPIGNGYYACFASVVTEDELEELLDEDEIEDEDEDEEDDEEFVDERGDLKEGIISGAKDEKEQFKDLKAHTDHIADIVHKIGKANHLVTSHTGWGDIANGTHEATIHGKRHMAAITTRIHKPAEGKGVETTYHVTTSVPGEHKKTFSYAEDALSHLAGLMAVHKNRFRPAGNVLVKKAVQRQVAEDTNDFKDNAENHGVQVAQKYLTQRTRQLKPRTAPFSQIPVTQGPATTKEQMRYDDEGKIEEEWKNREHFTSEISKHLSKAAPEVEHLEGVLGKHNTFDIDSESRYPHHEYGFDKIKGVHADTLHKHMVEHGYNPDEIPDPANKKGIRSYEKGPFTVTAHHGDNGNVHYAYLRHNTRD